MPPFKNVPLVFANILNLLWQIYYDLGQIIICRWGTYSSHKQTIWSQWIKAILKRERDEANLDQIDYAKLGQRWWLSW